MIGTIKKPREILTSREIIQDGILLIAISFIKRCATVYSGTYDQLMAVNSEYHKIAWVGVAQ